MTIGRISLVLIASKIDAGTRWVMKSLRLKAAVSTPLAAVTGGIGRFRPMPGCNRLTRIRPSVSETRLAPMNQPSERRPTRPERRNVAHVRDAGDQGRENQRRNDHLDQAQEQAR